MKSKSFLVFWISLHEIKKLYGGLLVSKKVINKIDRIKIKVDCDEIFKLKLKFVD